MKKAEPNISITDVKKTGVRKKIISRKTIFGLILVILLYLALLISSSMFIDISTQKDKNYVGEILGLIILFAAGVTAHKKIFKMPSKKVAKKTQEAAIEQKKVEELLHQKYVNGQRLIKTKDSSKVISGIHDLLEVALAFPEKRQKIINLLEGKNHWMKEHQKFLVSSNLVTWRLKNELFLNFEQDPQTISLEVLIAIEKIIKQHAEDFHTQEEPTVLDLTSKFIPALNLGFTEFPRKSAIFDFAFCWQINFWQSHLFDISFNSADLRGANFWKCKLSGVDFGGAKLENAKLKTDLTAVNNIPPSQFFLTQEWPVNILDTSKLKIFFPDQSPKNQQWRMWKSKQEERDLLSESLKEENAI